MKLNMTPTIQTLKSRSNVQFKVITIIITMDCIGQELSLGIKKEEEIGRG